MTSLRLLFAIVSTFALLSGTANGQAPNAERFAKIEANWLEWARINRVFESQLAIGYRGEIVHNRGLNINIEEPMALASLSKAITGACFLKLEKNGLFTRDTTLGELRAQNVLRSFSDSTADDVTLGEFLTHTSGLKPDITQGNVHRLFNRRRNRLEEIADDALLGRNINGNKGDFFYSNGNYAVLGAIIEGTSGETYEKTCTDELKSLKGFDGIKPSRLLLSISAFGGWESTAADFLEFANAAFGRGTDIQRNRFSLPHAKIDDGLYYGPGVVFRKNRTAGTNVWHFGALCFPDPGNDAGSYFAVIGDDWSVAVTHNVCLKGNASLNLDRTLMRGIFGRL